MKRFLPAVLAGLLVLPLSGCVIGSPEIDDMVRALEEEIYPAHLDARAEVKVGGSLLGLASWGLNWVDERDLDREQAQLLLRDLDAVHVGAYDVRGRRGRREPIRLSEEWRLQLEHEGWQVLVRVQNRYDETQWVLARPDRRGSIDGLYVVSVDDDEVVVVKLEGDLSRSIDYAVRRDSNFLIAMREAGDDL